MTRKEDMHVKGLEPSHVEGFSPRSPAQPGTISERRGPCALDPGQGPGQSRPTGASCQPHRGELPTIRSLDRWEIDAFNDATAAMERLIFAEEALRDRLRQCVPHGWRDMRMITSRLRDLLHLTAETFPPEKRRQMRRHASHCRIKLVYGPEASKDPEMHLVMTDDLGVIIWSCAERCKVCMGTDGECRRCQLGKALDRVSYVSREGRPWWSVFESQQQGE